MSFRIGLSLRKCPHLLKFQRLTSRCLRKTSVKFYSSRNILRLHERGLLEALFPDDSNDFLSLISSSRQVVYAGFDPTADSLHVGNLLVLVALLHCQTAGHEVIALVGGATGRVGDPSGISKERHALLEQNADENSRSIEKSILRIFNNYQQFISPSKIEFPVKVLNNKSWYKHESILDFLCKTCHHIRLGSLLSRQIVQSRLDSEYGLSLSELCYQAMQAHDWLHLFNKHGCKIQIGGSDQAGNIKTGHDLISKITKRRVYGLLLPLIKTESGDKLGKSAGNTVWLERHRSSPFELYQYFIRTSDTDVEKLLKIFTFLDVRMIEDIMARHKLKPEKREAQKVLAENVCLLVHGREGLLSAQRITDALYNRSSNLQNLSEEELREVFSSAPTVELLLQPGMTMLDLAMKVGCFSRNDDAVRIMLAGGFRINNEKEQNPETVVQQHHLLSNNVTVLRVGKKNIYLVKWTL